MNNGRCRVNNKIVITWNGMLWREKRKRLYSICVMGLIRIRIMENKSYSCLKYFFLAESFKFGCYNSLDNSWPALWERVVKMGRGLMETLNIEVLGNNTRKNNVKTFLLANELWLNFSGSLPGLSTFFHCSLIVWFLMDMIANCRSQHFLAISPVTIVKYSSSNHISCILHKLFPSLFFIQKICHDILICHHLPTHSKDSVVCRILQLACSLSCGIPTISKSIL